MISPFTASFNVETLRFENSSRRIVRDDSGHVHHWDDVFQPRARAKENKKAVTKVKQQELLHQSNSKDGQETKFIYAVLKLDVKSVKEILPHINPFYKVREFMNYGSLNALQILAHEAHYLREHNTDGSFSEDIEKISRIEDFIIDAMYEYAEKHLEDLSIVEDLRNDAERFEQSLIEQSTQVEREAEKAIKDLDLAKIQELVEAGFDFSTLKINIKDGDFRVRKVTVQDHLLVLQEKYLRTLDLEFPELKAEEPTLSEEDNELATRVHEKSFNAAKAIVLEELSKVERIQDFLGLVSEPEDEKTRKELEGTVLTRDKNSFAPGKRKGAQPTDLLKDLKNDDFEALVQKVRFNPRILDALITNDGYQTTILGHLVLQHDCKNKDKSELTSKLMSDLVALGADIYAGGKENEASPYMLACGKNIRFHGDFMQVYLMQLHSDRERKQ